MSSLIKDSLTDSKFHMWRSCMSVIHLDGEVSPKERKWAEEKIKFIPFSAEQETILLDDLKNGVDLSGILGKVTDKKDKAFLLHMVRTIGFLDGDFSISEKRAFKKLEEAILQNLDLSEIEVQISSMEKKSYHEDNVYKVANEHSLFEKMFQGAQKHLNPGDYKLP